MSSGGEAVFAAAGPRSAAEDELAAAAAVLAVDGTAQDTLASELGGTEKPGGTAGEQCSQKCIGGWAFRGTGGFPGGRAAEWWSGDACSRRPVAVHA